MKQIDLVSYRVIQVTVNFLVNWLTNAANDKASFYFLLGQDVEKVTAPKFFNKLWNNDNEHNLVTVFYSTVENTVILKVTS